MFDIITLDLETTGLYPSPTPEMISQGETEDFIVAIGCLDEYSLQIFSAPFETYKVSLEAAEKICLLSLSRYLDKMLSSEEVLLTYNGIHFDVPFISFKILKYSSSIDETNSLLDMQHIDLMGFSQHVTGRRLSKDDACRKLANLYVPRKSDGLWSARIYKNPQLLTENDHLEMLQHNATDLTATARLYNIVKQFPDFQEWRMKEIKKATKE